MHGLGRQEAWHHKMGEGFVLQRHVPEPVQVDQVVQHCLCHDMRDGLLPSDQVGDQVDLGQQPLGIGEQRRFLAYYRRVAGAEQAQGGAERDMQIQRNRRIIGQGGEPAGIDGRRDLGRDMRRGRIARVAGYGAIVLRDQGGGIHGGI